MPAASPSEVHPPSRENARAATRAIVERLHLLIYLSDQTQLEIEERVGFSRGYLSHLLGGETEIKLWHVLAVLHALDLEPADFFSDFFARDGSRASRALEGIRGQAGQKPLGLELARLYAYGIESISTFFERLELCEEALAELEEIGVLE